MTPACSSRASRSRTAGADMPTSSAAVARGLAPRTASSRRLVSSSSDLPEGKPFPLSLCRKRHHRPLAPSIAHGRVGFPFENSGMTGVGSVTRRMPPHVYFVVSAVFHYLGPALAVLLFARVGVLGVAWLRIATVAVVLGLWRMPWRTWRRLDRSTRSLLIAWAAGRPTPRPAPRTPAADARRRRPHPDRRVGRPQPRTPWCGWP
jgi:hypothetical protein